MFDADKWRAIVNTLRNRNAQEFSRIHRLKMKHDNKYVARKKLLTRLLRMRVTRLKHLSANVRNAYVLTRRLFITRCAHLSRMQVVRRPAERKKKKNRQLSTVLLMQHAALSKQRRAALRYSRVFCRHARKQYQL